MSDRIQVGNLSVAGVLHQFVNEEALPGTGVSETNFWAGMQSLISEFGAANRELLERRAQLQAAIDSYHRRLPGRPADTQAYADFLSELGYLVGAPADFEISTTDIDAEVALQAGPQLVVPLLNARFALNAANARWGSLYDALYGTDAISEDDGRERGASFNAVRAAAVIARGREFLDSYFPLQHGSHADVTAYFVAEGRVRAIINGEQVGLAEASQFVGYRGTATEPEAILLVHHRLHVEIFIDRTHNIGSIDRAGVRDLVLESAISTIMDLEDSVAAVDEVDKVLGYRNWLQLMRGELTEQVTKADRTFTRALNADRTYAGPDADTVTLPGRALLFIRQVGLHMYTDMITDADGNEVPEGLVDALVCGLASVHDLRPDAALSNSRTGSIYVVKPKLHGPDEVALTCRIFARVEAVLGLAPLTIKLGIMDEERRTSANLKACVFAARDRIAFINTGFLDRTGDEIHTSMLAGAMVRKADMRTQAWIGAYENNNVDVGLATGFSGRAQIGKGMWAAPDEMAAMLEQKASHPLAGATCAWVPSPTAATLHALHYHQVDVASRQRELSGRPSASRDGLLSIPLLDAANDGTAGLTPEMIQAELDNNVQGILGYVVRWIDAGVGCSKVPDLEGTALMEDRATCRISSQHVANWVQHEVITAEQVEQALRRMALVVDKQNSADPSYEPLAPSFDGAAFQAARALIVDGVAQPNGYTEPVLHAYRRLRKSQAGGP